MSIDKIAPVKALGVATATLAGAWAIAAAYRHQRRLPLPPGPPEKSWMAGSADDIPTLFKWIKFTEWAKEYGKRYNTLDLFETRGQIYSDRPVRSMPFLMGWRDIASFRDNDSHFKTFRRHTSIGFSKKAVADYHDSLTKEVHILLQRLLRKSSDLNLELNRFAASFIMKVTYGYSIIGSNDPYILASDEAFRSLIPAVTESYLVDSYPIIQYLPSWLPGMGFKRMAQEARKYPTKMAREPFEWTKEQIHRGNAAPSLVRRLLEENEDGEIGEEAIMWTAGSMYAGGAHTTVTAMNNFIAAMMLHPNIAKTLRWQPPASMGEFSVVKRVMITYYKGPEVSHRARQEDEYRGYRIPANSTIKYNMYAITRDERMFPDAENFIPERFDKSNLGPKPLEPRDFLFGVGRRVCPGQFVVDASLFLLMANIIATMDIRKTPRR
ncbi:cytochrome p450 [Rhizoctonia solani]|uniref:Cytochrome p450 n=1 Tax=Rhizoctonia solani TaxID=456999 RepID=A0A8H7I9A3_9AGAM|nr:cytochrome p450 [Rhizoctonia solani]